MTYPTRHKSPEEKCHNFENKNLYLFEKLVFSDILCRSVYKYADFFLRALLSTPNLSNIKC